MWVYVSFPEELPTGKLWQDRGQIVNESHASPEDQLPVIQLALSNLMCGCLTATSKGLL